MKLKTMTMLVVLMLSATIGLAASQPSDPEPVTPPPNMMKMDGAAPVCDGNVSYDANFFQAFKAADGTYTITMYFNPPKGVEFMNHEFNEKVLMGEFKFATVKAWLGNLNDKKQNAKMPEGEIDLEHKRVTFRGVKLSGTERVNMPVKFYDEAGNEIKIPNDTGVYGRGYAWGWIPSGKVGTPASVEGTPDNGWRFEVMPNGTLEPRGKKIPPQSL